MKHALVFILFIFLNVFSDGECVIETLKKMYNIMMEPAPSEAEEASLVLGVEDKSNFCVIANTPILKNRKNPNYGKYLFACPPETSDEIKINLEKSKTTKALFIKQAYGDFKSDDNKKSKKSDDENSIADPSELEIRNFEYIQYNCKEPVNEPSIRNIGSVEVEKIVIDTYLIGFEVYFEKKYEKLSFMGYNKFVTLNPGFQWLNVLTVRIDRKNGNVLTVNAESFNDDMDFPEPELLFAKKQVESNSLGEKTFFPDFWIKNVYSETRLQNLFENLFKNSPLKNVYYNKTQGRYLVGIYLVPLDSFVKPLLRKAALTYANIAPMWNIIRETSWARLENHLKHLVQGVYGMLVINGTYGTLTLSGTEIYLGSQKRVRVPLAFYKIITYPRTADEFYNILIITMNNPYEDVSNGICEKSQCKEYGWDYIEQDFYPYGRTMCCELTDENIDKLQLSGYIKVDRVLNLRAVPHRENVKLTLNLTDFIEDRKKGFSFNPDLQADHIDYRNEKDVELNSEKKPDKKGAKKDDQDDFSLSQFALMVFKDYVAPGLKTLTTKTKDYVESKAPLLRRKKSDNDAEKPLLGDEKIEAENENSVDDRRDGTEMEKSLEDQKEDNGTSKALESDLKVETDTENDQKDDNLEKPWLKTTNNVIAAGAA